MKTKKKEQSFNPETAKVGDVVPINCLCANHPGNSRILEAKSTLINRCGVKAIVDLFLCPLENEKQGGWQSFEIR